VNRFVILNHILSSYTASLLTQIYNPENEFSNSEHLKLLVKSLGHLESAIQEISTNNCSDVEFVKPAISNNVELINDDAILITEQLQFLSKISGDLQKIVSYLAPKEI